MAIAPKTPSILPEWNEFKKNLPPDFAYDKLLTTAAEAGFDYDLEQTAVEGLADGGTMVTFLVSIGRDGKLEPYKTVSHRLPPGPGAVSLAARVQIVPTLIFLFFGRLPPQQQPAAPEQTVDVGDGGEGDIVLPEAETEEADAGGEYVQDSAPISRRRTEDEAVQLIDHTEPDGVPVFVDPDDLPESIPAKAIVRKLIDGMNEAAVKFKSVEQLLALYSKNSVAMSFIKAPYGNDEFGEPIVDADVMAWRVELRDMLDKHQARLETPAREVRIPGGKGSPEAAPRRRRAA